MIEKEFWTSFSYGKAFQYEAMYTEIGGEGVRERERKRENVEVHFFEIDERPFTGSRYNHVIKPFCGYLSINHAEPFPHFIINTTTL